MDEDLRNIIEKYQSAVATMFPKVAAHLGIELPVTNVQWAASGALQRGRTPEGIDYFIHGYGVAMRDGSSSVDCDLGDRGQIDGIDAWKLAGFVEQNGIATEFENGEAIETAVKEAEEAGKLLNSGNLLYCVTNDL